MYLSSEFTLEVDIVWWIHCAWSSAANARTPRWIDDGKAFRFGLRISRSRLLPMLRLGVCCRSAACRAAGLDSIITACGDAREISPRIGWSFAAR